MSEAAFALAAAHHASVEAPAGCGKTHLIAQAVRATAGTKPTLVLTHTHAGVEALRKRMTTFETSQAARVDTIAGWALRTTTSYPTMAGIPCGLERSGDWPSIYLGAARLVGTQAMKAILRASYSGVLVDEYQDCSIEQHRLVSALAELLPCRVLGDPLQGIFDFDRRSRLVDWGVEVVASFPPLAVAQAPHRWASTNPQLGRWLLSIRDALKEGAPIDLARSPIEHQQPQPNIARQIWSICGSTLKDGRSVTIIRDHKNQSEHLARSIGAPFRCIDAVDDGDAIKLLEAILAARGSERAAAIVRLLTKATTGATATGKWVDAIAKGGGARITKNREAFDALCAAAATSEARSIAGAIDAIVALPDTRTVRRQLLRDARSAVEILADGDATTASDAVWMARNGVRHLGRTLARATVGRTLLVKGLEFDHVVVLDAERMNARNLYVALTRGTTRVTVLSERTTITPKSR